MTEAAKNLALSIVTVVFGAAYLFATYELPTRTGIDPLGPKAFPALIGIAMILCGVSLALSSAARARVHRADASGNEAGDSGHPWAVLAVAGWLLIYFLAYVPIGFLLSTVVFLFVFMSYFNRGKWLVNGIVAVAFPVVLNLIFSEILGSAPAPGIFAL